VLFQRLGTLSSVGAIRPLRALLGCNGRVRRRVDWCGWIGVGVCESRGCCTEEIGRGVRGRKGDEEPLDGKCDCLIGLSGARMIARRVCGAGVLLGPFGNPTMPLWPLCRYGRVW
jgi:hypothetical protein